ncbi:MAG: ABC transporter ATP-binding protein/permease [Spirochaetaceae bacterium]|jgi:ATP-binding cassette subfamily B protein|nr:ABC transporter ATP-binding protein/permease [Spirochaetaceae bacterium]
MKNASFREYRSLFPYMKPYLGKYLVGFFFLLLVDAAQIFIPQCIRQAIDIITPGSFDARAVYKLSAVIIVLALVISGGRFLWRYFIHGSSRRIETEIRQNLFDHMITLSYDFYQRNKIGDLMARATNDLNAVRMAIGMGFVAFIDGTVMSITILIIMFVQEPQTAAFAIIPLPVITLLILFFGSLVGKRFQRVQETYSGMSDTVQETFAGIRVVKSFVKEWWFIRKFADTNKDYRQANMAVVKIFGIFFPLISFLSGMTTLILLLVGGAQVIEGTLTTGELAAFFSYLQMMIWPMLGVGFMVNMMQRGAASLARINEIFNEEPAIASPAKPAAPDMNQEPKIPAEPSVSIRNLSFSYAPEDAPAEAASGEFSGESSGEGAEPGRDILRDISIDIPSGMIIGILGKTGSGKTTLLKTLMRLIDPPPGTVFVHGTDVREWNLELLRSRFGVIPQDTYLFSDSIKNNISYGVTAGYGVTGAHERGDQDRGDLDRGDQDRRLKDAAETSAIAKDLEGFAGGWDTIVGERGLTLSGGQKQRVAISRALSREPEFLIMDDALSAVDAETERTILDRLLEKRRGGTACGTTIIVSHRVSTLQNTDFVIVLENGRIAESGTPKELAAGKGFFSRMAQLQRLEK